MAKAKTKTISESSFLKQKRKEWGKLANESQIPKDIQAKVRSSFDKRLASASAETHTTKASALLKKKG